MFEESSISNFEDNYKKNFSDYFTIAINENHNISNSIFLEKANNYYLLGISVFNCLSYEGILSLQDSSILENNNFGFNINEKSDAITLVIKIDSDANIIDNKFLYSKIAVNHCLINESSKKLLKNGRKGYVNSKKYNNIISLYNNLYDLFEKMSMKLNINNIDNNNFVFSFSSFLFNFYALKELSENKCLNYCKCNYNGALNDFNFFEPFKELRNLYNTIVLNKVINNMDLNDFCFKYSNNSLSDFKKIVKMLK